MMELPEVNPNCLGCQALIKIIEQLQAQIKIMQDRIDKLERESKRQAAPFRKPTKTNPKKPGRKPGKDYGSHRRRQEPEKIDEHYSVPLPSTCPDCGCSEMAFTQTVTQYQIEIPQTVIHRQFDIDVGCCQNCGCRVQGRHELQTSDAVGAAAVQFGSRVHAAMALLNKELGLSHGKIRRLLKMLFGISVSRSTSCRSLFRTSKRLRPAYQEIAAAVRASPQVVADETGWRVDAKTSWLHAFVGLKETYYTIDPTRSGIPAMKLLGEKWAGVLGHDGWSVYDNFVNANHQQCLAHLLRRCEKLIEVARGGAVSFPKYIKGLLLKGLEYLNRFQTQAISAHGLLVVAGRLQNELLDKVRNVKTHPGNERLAKFVWNHSNSIFTFLRMPGFDATNWRGEQAIRPAVVNRKVWGGNRNSAGANTQSIIMSVFRTCQNRATDAYDYIRHQLTAPQAIPLPP